MNRIVTFMRFAGLIALATGFAVIVGAPAAARADVPFKPGVDPVALLDPIVQREMDKRWQSYGGPAPHNTLGARTYQNFALTDDAVIFYIWQGMWLAEVAGPQFDLNTPVGAGISAGLGARQRR